MLDLKNTQLYTRRLCSDIITGLTNNLVIVFYMEIVESKILRFNNRLIYVLIFRLLLNWVSLNKFILTDCYISQTKSHKSMHIWLNILFLNLERNIINKVK